MELMVCLQHSLDMLVLLFAVFLLSPGSTVAEDNSQECDAWNKTVQTLKIKERQYGNITCLINQPCTGFDCNGKFHSEFLGHTVEEFVRFGVEFIPCLEPTVMDLWVIVGPNIFFKNFTLNNAGSNVYNLSIPAASSNITVDGVSVQITNNASITLSPSSSPGHAIISMNIILHIAIPSLPVIDQNLTLIPPQTEVVIPSCIESKTTPRRSTPPPPVTIPQIGPTSGPLIKCKPSTMDVCHGQNQFCMVPPGSDFGGLCMCLSKFYWDVSRNQCILGLSPFTVTPPIKTANTTQDQAIPQGGSNVLVIVLSCIGTLLVLGIIIAVIRHRYLRYRQRYGQHDLLINNEAENDLEEVDPPMIEA